MKLLLAIVLVTLSFAQKPTMSLIINNEDIYDLNKTELTEIELPKTIRLESDLEIFSSEVYFIRGGRQVYKYTGKLDETVKLRSISRVENMVLILRLKDKREKIYSIPIKYQK